MNLFTRNSFPAEMEFAGSLWLPRRKRIVRPDPLRYLNPGVIAGGYVANRPSMFTLNASSAFYTGLQLALLGNNASGSSTSNDSSTNTLNGTLHNFTGSPWVIDSTLHRNSLTTFDGSTRYVDVGTNAALQVQSDMTLVAWIYPTASAAAGILGKTTPSAGSYPDKNADYLILQNGLTLQAIVGNGTTATSVVGGSLTLNVWNPIALTISGTTARLWLNGVASGSPVTISGRMVGSNFCCGLYDLTPELFFTGAMADVMLWSVAQSSTLIGKLANPANPLLNDGTVNLCV
jgi:Concanavalin A-like lectin/glucanases superfamily